MKKYAIPKIFDFDCYRDYMTAFITLNESKTCSRRMIARRLKWPPSYLVDMLTGRKNLTINRALQFSSFANFDVFETERIILLALRDSKEPAVSHYFNEQLSLKQNRRKLPTKVAETVDHQLFFKLELIALYNLLLWGRRSYTAQEVRDLLFTFPNMTNGDVNALMVEIMARGLIKVHADGSVEPLIGSIYIQDPNDPHHEASNALIHTAYAQNFINALKRMPSPRSFYSGFFALPLEKMDEIFTRLRTVQNWLIGVEEAHTATPASERGRSLLFQLDLNLFPIVDPKSLG